MDVALSLFPYVSNLSEKPSLLGLLYFHAVSRMCYVFTPKTPFTEWAEVFLDNFNMLD